MEQAIYLEMDRVEKEHWWFKARKDIVIQLLKHWGRLNEGHTILDLGCGTGSMMEALLSYPVKVEGRDFSDDSLTICSRKGLKVEKGVLPYHLNVTKPVDTVLLLDVLEHIEDDLVTLEALHRVVKEDGRVLLTVPAHPLLWSEHDERHHHFRRYSKRQLNHLATRAGWQIEFISYYNSFLFPLGLIVRAIKRVFRIDIAETMTPSPVINRIFYQVFVKEAGFLKVQKSLPSGLSLIISLKK